MTNNSCFNLDSSQLASICTDASIMGSLQMQSAAQLEQPQHQPGQLPQMQMQMPQMHIQMAQTLPQVQMLQAPMQLPQAPPLQMQPGQPQVPMLPNQMQTLQMPQPQVSMEQFQMQAQRLMQMQQPSLQSDVMPSLQSQLLPQMLVEVPPLACLCSWLAGNSRVDGTESVGLFPVPGVTNPGGTPPVVPGTTRWADEPLENPEIQQPVLAAATMPAPQQPCGGAKVTLSAMHFPEPSASAMVQARTTTVQQPQPQPVPGSTVRTYK